MTKRSLAEIIALFSHEIGGKIDVVAQENYPGLTTRQFLYLETIGEMGNPTFSELTARLGLSKPSVTAIVRTFMQKNYVSKEINRKDKRSYRIHLTRQGIELNKKHQELHLRFAQHLTQKLTAAEHKNLVDILNKIIDS